MKSKRYLFSVFFIFCLGYVSSSQNLELAKGTEPFLYSKHFVCESNTGDSILFYKGYAVVFSYRYHLPLYTFHLLTVDQLKADSTRLPVKRSNSFHPALLPNGTLSASNIDYSKSGYDRGHMVPAGDFVWNKELKDETFFYTNINPQLPALNRGVWANLENLIRSKVLGYAEDAYVVTGVAFNSSYMERIGPNGLPVPVAFFKIIYFEKSKTMYAFLFDNTIETYIGAITDFQVPVDFIEQITGEDFFDELDDQLEAQIESVIVDFKD